MSVRVLLAMILIAGLAAASASSARGLGPQGDPVWSAEGDQEDAGLGTSVASAGDVNGDGYDDVIVGAPRHSGGQASEGGAFVYHGSPTGLSETPDWAYESDQRSARLGISVASAGDVNGDGYDDVIVGAYRFNATAENGGRIFVFHGSRGGLGARADVTLDGERLGDNFGHAVASAGDVNGDGYADVIVGAWYSDVPDPPAVQNTGRAYLYYGSRNGVVRRAAWESSGEDQSGAQFGVAVGGAGDVNGDGYDDVIVGAWSHDGDFVNEGRAYVFHGSPDGLSQAADWTASGGQEAAQLGVAVGGAGDVNGDGYDDVVVGSHLFDGGEVEEGAAAVYHGASDGLAEEPAWAGEGDQTGARFGISVGTADVNGDGFGDVLVGAWFHDGELDNEGRVLAFAGSADGLLPAGAWFADGGYANAGLGFAVAGAGDVDGDGYDEIIAGAPTFDNGQNDEGGAFVFDPDGFPPDVTPTSEATTPATPGATPTATPEPTDAPTPTATAPAGGRIHLPYAVIPEPPPPSTALEARRGHRAPR